MYLWSYWCHYIFMEIMIKIIFQIVPSCFTELRQKQDPQKWDKCLSWLLHICKLIFEKREKSYYFHSVKVLEIVKALQRHKKIDLIKMNFLNRFGICVERRYVLHVRKICIICAMLETVLGKFLSFEAWKVIHTEGRKIFLQSLCSFLCKRRNTCKHPLNYPHGVQVVGKAKEMT